MQNPEGAQVADESQTTTFVDPSHQEAYMYPERDLKPFHGDTQEHLDLADFLKRPTKIYTSSWSGGFSAATINPWSLFFNNSVIKNKIQNFAYFSGNLHVRVVINTNPFLYGSLMVNYQPLYANTNAPNALTSLITHSQLPHIMVEPQVNDGGEMLLPFIYQKQFVDITSAADVASLGQMNLIPLSLLLSASETYSGAITITIYAWVDEPKLFGPTTKLALQAGDEYGNGPVSAPAAMLAKFASQFNSTPIIGKWATATSIGASAVSSIAKLFGWSNVPVIEDVKPIKLTFFHDLASAHISEPTNKVTLDPKAELSVDPTIIGVKGEDELAVSKIAEHDSYLWQSNWDSSQVQGDVLFSAAVSPRMFLNQTPDGNGTSIILQTPMCMLSEVFSHWRGDVIFKFRFICSKFHRGRVMISFDPVGNLTGITDTGNTAITKIVDIGETTEYEFRVPYMQTLPWLATTKSIDRTLFFSDTGVVAPISGATNGSIVVRVLTNLTAPRATSAITMQTWVRGADNLEFANPCDVQNRLFPWQLQSGQEKSDACVDRFKINWGEPIPSVRLLLRRSVPSENLQFATGTSTDRLSQHFNRHTRFPVPPGYGVGALTAKSVASVSQINYSYSKFTPLHWIARCYLANRGSFRYHYVPYQTTSKMLMKVTRHTDNTVASSNVGYLANQTQRSSAEALSTGASRLILSDFSESGSGVVVVDTNSSPGLTVEYPMMTNYLFSFNKLDQWALGNSADGTDLDTYVFEYQNSPNNGATQDYNMVQKYVCAGTDFNLFFFLCVPPLYFNAAGGNPT